MNRQRCLLPSIAAASALWIISMIQPASAQQSGQSFTYHSPGVMTFAGDGGIRDRRVFFPQMRFPLRTGPESGADGKPLRAFANSQVFIPPGFGTNDQRLYVFPWTDTLCESKHVGGAMPLCPNPQHRGHQGVDIRPDAPTSNTFDVVAWVDGIVTFVSSNPSSTTEVNIRDAANNGTECVYLHLQPGNVRIGQTVNKGDVIGKVSNHMAGGGTSIHLHFECKATHPDLRANVKMPVYTSLIAAYRREWGLPDMIQSGVLLRDPERELDPGTLPQGDPSCSEPLASPLAATKDRPFKARYTHNCSEMGLTLDASTQNMEIVYVRPKQSLQRSAERSPVLASGKLTANGDFTGQALNFNSACSDPKFNVAGKVDFSDTEIILEGDRQSLDASCNPSGPPRHEVLRFAMLGTTPQSHGGDPLPIENQNCPFALPPGQLPVVVDGKEIPPKSERSCNFTALTVPGGISFSQMPRYIREWPGVRKDILQDKNEDQIITFQSAETGVGAWWYWLTQRAVNGPDQSKRGFGVTGKPTMSAVARGIAGAHRSEDFVRKTYLGPYLTFASEFFGRTISETDLLDLSSPDVRWNLARTMFRLESGRTPVVGRKQFDCGIQLGNDVLADFMRANVEGSATGQVTFTSFKTLAAYINCGAGGPTGPGTAGEVATLDQAKQQIKNLTSQVAQLQQNLADSDQRLKLANSQIGDLQRRIAELVGTQPPPNDTSSGPSESSLQTRVLALQRALQLSNQMLGWQRQMFDSQQELCKLNQTICRPD
jgi:murein DD-endopeptidase MepM/ murein hydrolase activator NlpD